MIADLRQAHHGGTVLVLPPDCAAGSSASDFVQLKYPFADGPARRRYRQLVLDAMRELVIQAGGADTVTWDMYRSARSPALGDLEEGLFEVSHLFAALAEVDGAIVLTKRFELLGFGGEITGDLPDVPVIQRALDLEGTRKRSEVASGVGTRHRSAYRLCGRFHGALAIVVSQDGGVQFVKWHDGAVTAWQHGSSAGEG